MSTDPSRPAEGSPYPESTINGALLADKKNVLKSAFAAFLAPLGFAAFFLVLIGLWAYFQSGSAASILPYLGGQRIFVRPLEVAFGRKAPGEFFKVSTTLSNRSTRALKILGSQRECGCVSTEVFPLVVKPGADHRLSVSVALPPKEGPFLQRVTYFTDHSEKSRFEVRLIGTVGR